MPDHLTKGDELHQEDGGSRGESGYDDLAGQQLSHRIVSVREGPVTSGGLVVAVWINPVRR